jgi:hypothetical protein
MSGRCNILIKAILYLIYLCRKRNSKKKEPRGNVPAGKPF